jgi:hypothetical protein
MKTVRLRLLLMFTKLKSHPLIYRSGLVDSENPDKSVDEFGWGKYVCFEEDNNVGIKSQNPPSFLEIQE